MPVRIDEVAALALDVDTPDDLAALVGRARRSAAARRSPPAAPSVSSTAPALAPRASLRLSSFSVTALAPLPAIRPGDDLAALIAAAAPADLAAGDVVVVAHKVVSKAEGRLRRLEEIEPGEPARRLAEEHGKDARLVQAVLDESAEVLRAAGGTLVCVTHHGFVCANAGVDQSNASEEAGELVLLPEDPDGSARRLRAGIDAALGVRPAVVIADSFGRAWRLGQTDVAIGAGIVPLAGPPIGRDLRVTSIAVADGVAAAADLARAKDSLEPAVLVRGLDRFVTADDGQGAAALRRPPRTTSSASRPLAREELTRARRARARARALRDRGRRPGRRRAAPPARRRPVPLGGQPPIGARGFLPQKICVPSIPTRCTATVFSTIDFAVAVPTPTGPAARRCSRSSTRPARSRSP